MENGLSENQKVIATLALKNAVVYTMNDRGTTAEAVAVRDDQIIYVGSNEGLEQYIGKETEIMDLQKKVIVPSFVDAHIHQPMEQIFQLYTLNLADKEPSIQEYQESLKRFAEMNPELKTILGTGFSINAFDEDGPHKKYLDEIVGDRPVILVDTSVHTRFVNSKALERHGITRETEPPAGGKIYKSEDGEPTGFFSDCPSFFPEFYDLVSSLTEEQYLQAFKQFEKDCAGKGITAIQGATGGDWKMISELASKNDLNLRVNLTLVMEPEEDADQVIQILNEGQQYVSDFQKITTVKIFYDGVTEGGTALLLEPYDTEAGMPANYKGTPRWEMDKLKAALEAIDKAGYQVHVHAIGDGAARQVLDVIEYAFEKNGKRDARHTITHLDLIQKEDIARMGNMGVIAAMQPIWFYKNPTYWELELKMLGQERFERMYAVKDMLDAGVTMTGSADNPIIPDNRPLFGIETGVTRCSPYEGEKGKEEFNRNQDQCLTALDLLRAYTINGARQIRMETTIGSLEPGKKADMVILDQDILKVQPEDISRTNITYTIFNGKVIFTKS